MNTLFNQISVESLLKEFNCSVCLNQIQDCFTTKCGHTFCKACIYESVNRHHRCPACQEQITENEYFRNIAMNNLHEIILEEERKAKENYIQTLYDRMGLNKRDELEGIFVDTLKEHMIVFKNHLNKIEHEFETTNSEIAKAQNEDEKKIKLEELGGQYMEIKTYILSTLKKHLDSLIPNPHMLDIVCTIYLPQKNITLSNISIQPYKSISTIQNIIENELKKLNHTIYFNENPGLIIILPPEKRMLYHDKLLSKANENTETETYLSKVKDLGLEIVNLNSQALITIYNVAPYSTFIYVGEYKFKEEIPPECITYNYQPGKVVNYFSCENCNANWICQPCAEYCHKGHSLCTHLSNKKTTWACCYCVKNQLCRATNKDSQK